jgi:hypothetical protein
MQVQLAFLVILGFFAESSARAAELFGLSITLRLDKKVEIVYALRMS